MSADISEDVLEALEEQVTEQTAAVMSDRDDGDEDEDNTMAQTTAAEAAAAVLQETHISSQMISNNEINQGLNDADLDKMLGEKIRFEREVEEFLRRLYEEVYDRNVDSLRKLYEADYPAISERYFSDQRWPAVEDVERFYRQFDRYHQLIITLYKELYFRHLFLKCANDVQWEDRKSSWENYSMLLTYLAEVESKPDEGKSLCLPIQWIWDMLDEFVYQYHEACRWRGRISRKLPEDEEERSRLLKEIEYENDIWRSGHVFEYLYFLVVQTNIHELVKESKEDSTKLKIYENQIRFQLGFFSMILLLKLHVLIGDYYGGMRVIEDIEISNRSLYWKVPAAHLTLFYHLGFAYMMLRRYNDAIRLMSQLLIYCSRQRMYIAGSSYQQSTINKTIDKMYSLVMLCGAVCNVKLDESVNQIIRERHLDKYYKLQLDNEEAYRNIFQWACPKFITPAMPSHDDPHSADSYASSHTEVHLRQMKMFLKEVEVHRKSSTINSFAKLYSNIQLSKLASLMEIKGSSPEESCRSEIISVKYRGRQRVWKSGCLLNGDFLLTSSDQAVDFYVDHDMIHVRSQSTQRIYIDHFLKQLERSQMLLNTIQRSSPSSSSGNYSKSNHQNRDSNRDSNRYQNDSNSSSSNSSATRDRSHDVPFSRNLNDQYNEQTAY